MTTVLGYGARPPGTYTAARATGASRMITVWPGKATWRSSRSPAVATSSTFAIALLEPAADGGIEPVQSAVELGLVDAERLGLGAGGVEAARVVEHGLVAALA